MTTSRILTMWLLALSLVPSLGPLFAQPKTPPKTAAPVKPGASDTVWVTKDGKRYHNDSCRMLGKSRTPMSLKDAKAQGYTACKICKPAA